MKNSDLSSPYLNRITVKLEQCGGRPCIRDTRLRVSDVLDLLASGESFGEIMADYAIERDDIVAALHYAARQLDYNLIADEVTPERLVSAKPKFNVAEVDKIEILSRDERNARR